MDQVKILSDFGDFLAVHKNAGWLTIPGRGNKEHVPVLSHVLGKQLRQGADRKSESPDLFTVHRLDEPTSGVVLFARNAEAHRELSSLFEAGKVQKKYWALTDKTPTVAVVDAPIFKLPSKKNKSVISAEKGKSAKTLIRPLITQEGLTVVEAAPLTGRSHQIRVHLSHIGCPLLGDKLYGGSQNFKHHQVENPQLFAREIQFQWKGNLVQIVDENLDPHFEKILNESGISVKGCLC